MHVLHVETGMHLYGGALQVLYLMEGLRSEECRNTLVCAKGSDVGGARAVAAAVVYNVPLAGELDPRFLFHLLKIIRAERPDILHVHSRRGADIWGALAARLTRTKAVITRRVDNPERVWLMGAKYKLYHGVIAISQGIRQVLLSEGLPASKVACVHSAVDGVRYGKPCEKAWLAREFGLDPSKKLCAVVAQFIPRKGHRLLIEAIPSIVGSCPEAHFLFFGRGPLEEELQGLCKRIEVADRVSFVGFRPDLERILPCLDLIVHPASMEGLGVSLLEAAVSGVPIVATRAGGIPEIVHNGVNGYLFERGDKQAMIQAVLTLLLDPGKAKRFGRAGRDIVRSRFSVDAMVEGNLRVYGQVMSSTFGHHK